MKWILYVNNIEWYSLIKPKKKSLSVASEANSRSTVYPLRIDSQGHPFPQHLQFRRKGQSAWYGRTLYKFHGFNRTWIIELQPQHKLGTTKLDLTTFIQSQCYYRGHVLGQTLSSVKVNLCGGMVSLHTILNEFFIKIRTLTMICSARLPNLSVVRS